MSWLTVDDIDLKISGDAASKEVVRIGGYSRAFDGSLRSSILAEKNEWTFGTVPLDEADATAIEAALANGVTVTLEGDVVGASEYSVKGTVVGSRYVMHNLVHRRELSLLLQEV